MCRPFYVTPDLLSHQIGIFVWDYNSAKGKQPSIQRHGSDIIVLWDAEQPQTDVFLECAFWLARSLAVSQTIASDHARFIHQQELTAILDQLDLLPEHLDKLRDCAIKITRQAKNITEECSEIEEKLRDVAKRLRTQAERVQN